LKLSIVVLAAGQGTRMRSDLPKVLHRLAGRTMVGYVVDAARALEPQRLVVVVGYGADQVRAALGDGVPAVLQAEQLGTGHAVWQARESIAGQAGTVLVLYGDTPLIQPATLRAMIDQHASKEAAVTLLTFRPDNPAGYGRVVREAMGGMAGRVVAVVEERDATPEQRAIGEVNSGILCFRDDWLWPNLARLSGAGRTGVEIYLTDLVRFARQDGRLVAALDVADDGRLTGINDRTQLARAEWDMRVDMNDRWMRAGVTMVDPSTVYLDHEVELAQDVVIEPNVILRGATRIGERTRIAAGSQIVDSVIGPDCVVWASVIERSTVEDHVTIGPFSHLRPGSHVGRRSEIGNYAEIKNSRLGEHVRQHHASYLGDAEVGADTNVGAGTITANYDGVHKHRTVIGERVFLGVDTMLRAPITLGDDARTGAGAVVTKDVPAGKLAVGVPARLRDPRPLPPKEAPAAAATHGVADAPADTTTEPATGGGGTAS
jgi:bifunctional UDP-N-acetylglucosamine pyrophosphorylase/glucosamine-1-phosphate N-acetyltransferase